MKPQEVEAMKAAITETAARFGATVKFHADPDLAKLRKGRNLTAGELRGLADGSVVWATWREHGEQGYRMNGPYRIRRTEDEDTWFLDDGSSFAGEFCVAGLPADAVAADDAGGAGEGYVFEVREKGERKKRLEPFNCTCHVSLWQGVCLPGCPRGTQTGRMYPTWDDVPDDVLTDERYEARHGRLPPRCTCERRVYDADQGKCPLCATKAQREGESKEGVE